jgi:hypothetical protein
MSPGEDWRRSRNMIPHDGPRLARTIRDAGSMLNVIIAAIMGTPGRGFRATPKLPAGCKPATPIERRPKVAAFDVSVRMRGGRRVDPVAERRRYRAAS